MVLILRLAQLQFQPIATVSGQSADLFPDPLFYPITPITLHSPSVFWLAPWNVFSHESAFLWPWVEPSPPLSQASGAQYRPLAAGRQLVSLCRPLGRLYSSWLTLKLAPVHCAAQSNKQLLTSRSHTARFSLYLLICWFLFSISLSLYLSIKKNKRFTNLRCNKVCTELTLYKVTRHKSHLLSSLSFCMVHEICKKPFKDHWSCFYGFLIGMGLTVQTFNCRLCAAARLCQKGKGLRFMSSIITAKACWSILRSVPGITLMCFTAFRRKLVSQQCKCFIRR